MPLRIRIFVVATVQQSGVPSNYLESFAQKVSRFVVELEPQEKNLWHRAEGHAKPKKILGGQARGTLVYINSSGQIIVEHDPESREPKDLLVQFTADAITTQDEGIYLGGSRSSGIALMSKTSSLIFFGVNPPFSFVVLGLLIAAAAASILWFRRRWKKRFRPPSSSMGYRLQKIPADASLNARKV